MLFDSKGRLFGKISIVDILIIVIIAGAALGVYYKYGKTDKGVIFTKTDKIQMTLYYEDAANFAVNAIKVGDTVKDRVNNVVMGKVTKIDIGPDTIWNPNSEGKEVASSKDGFSAITVTVQGEGSYSSAGVTINGVDYYVNKSAFEVRIGIANFYLKITSITKL